MNHRRESHEKAESFFESLWGQGDPWELESSEFEQRKYDREIRILKGRRYRNVLEMGCGAGAFTLRLDAISDRLLALDVSPTAISRAREAGLEHAEFRVQNVIEFDPRNEGPWDLMVLNEIVYYLGWLYTFFDVTWFAAELFNSTRIGGELLMANTRGGTDDYLLSPYIIRTYHDLFTNVGYTLTSEELFTGKKNDVELEVVISLFTKLPKAENGLKDS
jgi:SAM-dependent methyltransferase